MSFNSRKYVISVFINAMVLSVVSANITFYVIINMVEPWVMPRVIRIITGVCVILFVYFGQYLAVDFYKKLHELD
jgi:hypothetical protein